MKLLIEYNEWIEDYYRVPSNYWLVPDDKVSAVEAALELVKEADRHMYTLDDIKEVNIGKLNDCIITMVSAHRAEKKAAMDALYNKVQAFADRCGNPVYIYEDGRYSDRIFDCKVISIVKPQ